MGNPIDFCQECGKARLWKRGTMSGMPLGMISECTQCGDQALLEVGDARVSDISQDEFRLRESGTLLRITLADDGTLSTTIGTNSSVKTSHLLAAIGTCVGDFLWQAVMREPSMSDQFDGAIVVLSHHAKIHFDRLFAEGGGDRSTIVPIGLPDAED